MTHESPSRSEMNARLDASHAQTLVATKPLEARMAQFEKTVDKVMAGFTDLKRTVVITGISTVLGVGALNAAILSNIQSSFDSGKMVGIDIAGIRAEMREERQALLAELRKDIGSVAQDVVIMKSDTLDIREQIGITLHQLDNKVDRVPVKAAPRPGRPTRDLFPAHPR